jgi:hypothetical protein
MRVEWGPLHGDSLGGAAASTAPLPQQTQVAVKAPRCVPASEQRAFSTAARLGEAES